MQSIYATLVTDPLQFALSTRVMIQMVITKQFGLCLSVRSVGRLLAQLGRTCQRPLFRAYQQYPVLGQQWRRARPPGDSGLGEARVGADLLW